MTVLVVYGTAEDQTAADAAASALETQGIDALALPDTQVGTVEYASFRGVLLVGGSNANDVYQRRQAEFGWDEPLPLEGGSYRYVINGINFKAGSPIIGIAGYTDEDTERAMEAFLQAGSIDDRLDAFGNLKLQDFVAALRDTTDETEDDDSTQDDGDDSKDGSEEAKEYILKWEYSGLADSDVGESALAGAGTLLTEIRGMVNPFISGWEILDATLLRDQNRLHIRVRKTGSISLTSLAAIIAASLGVLGSTGFLSWAFVEATTVSEKKQRLQNKQFNDAEKQLQNIINSEDASEETKRQAREALIEILGKQPAEVGGGSSGGFFGFLDGFNDTAQTILLIVLLYIAARSFMGE